MPGSRVNLGMGQPGRKKKAKGRAAKKAKGSAVKKAKGGAMMEPPGMKGGGGVEDSTLPKGKFKTGGGVGKRGLKKVPASNPGLEKLPEKARNNMGYMNQGGAAKKAKGAAMMKPPPKMTKGGSVYKKGKKSGPKP